MLQAGPTPRISITDPPRRDVLSSLTLSVVGVALIWLSLSVLVLALGMIRADSRLPFLASTALGLGVNLALMAASERRRWVLPLRRFADQAEALIQAPASSPKFAGPPSLDELAGSLNRLSSASRRLAALAPKPSVRPADSNPSGIKSALTRSAMMDRDSSTDLLETNADTQASGEYPAFSDMVNRLEPKLLRWLESSAPEQRFLGWNLAHLREKSFLEIVHPDDVDRVRDRLREAVLRGEIHGLILRIRTAHGKSRAIEMNVGARYGPDMTVSHLRCHVTDVTAKLRAERELRLRTRELTQVNDQLRLINRELEELKERYRDLYQNAPAMYFSLDVQGRVLDCNDTLLNTLGYRREVVVGRSYDRLLPESRRPLFASRFAQFLNDGRIEVASQWIKSGGEVIDVLVTGTAVRDHEGRIVHSRSIAQDVTTRHRLEAELVEKNECLAFTIDELSRRNKEMDEFTYVVSHDLQEPIRTLIAFSDFLQRDYGDRLDAEGQEFVQLIVDASRRMRALIHDLLSLSRVGKVTSDFAVVNINEVLGDVRADLTELIRSRNAEFIVPAPLPELCGDRSRIGQLLVNLVSNALKYNKSPIPSVEVTLQAETADFVTLAVRDNGIGIEPEFRTRIFQLFRRLHTREEYEGTGAGLAICLKIVEAHGGRIWVEGESGQGSTFLITLPKPPAAPPIEAPHET